MAKKEAEVHGIRIKETRADRTFNVLNLIFWMIVLFITLYPLWLVLIASVSDPDALLAGEVLFWPKGFSLMGYEAVFQHSELWQSYLNSIIYTVLGSALSVIVSLAAAYALSRKFAGKAFVNFLITFTMFFSGGLIPIFLNVRDLGLYDTRLVMILMNTVSVWNLMVARTYIQSSIPNELYEAAVMDGADHFTYFFRCVLPLSGTIIAVLSVYYGVARWNDYFTGLVFIRNRAYLPLQTVLREILASLSISGSSDTFFAAYADNLGGLQEAMRKAEVAKYGSRDCAVHLHAEVFRQGRYDWVAEGIILSDFPSVFLTAMRFCGRGISLLRERQGGFPIAPLTPSVPHFFRISHVRSGVMNQYRAVPRVRMAQKKGDFLYEENRLCSPRTGSDADARRLGGGGRQGQPDGLPVHAGKPVHGLQQSLVLPAD